MTLYWYNIGLELQKVDEAKDNTAKLLLLSKDTSISKEAREQASIYLNRKMGKIEES